jgi:Fur family transcriptional regulator, ferric uptake regulator
MAVESLNKVEFKEALREAGLRVTKPRLKVLAIVRDHGKPLSSEEIHHKALGSMDLVTVYRTLHTLAQANILRRSDLSDGLKRYELDQGDHKHYIVCRSCKEIEPLSHCVFHPLEVRLKKMGYGEIAHRLEVTGLCNSCKTAS